MPQIQYPSIAFPPEQTPPTSDKMGWRPSEPDQVRYHSKNRMRPDAYQPYAQTTGATVFAVENWTAKFGWNQSEGPDLPQQFLAKRLPTAANPACMVRDFTISTVIVTVSPELPDDPMLGRRRGLPLAVTTDASTDGWVSQEQWPPLLIGSAIYPATTRRAILYTADLPYSFRGESPEQYPQTLLWSTSYPDTTTRSALKTATIPSFAVRGEAPEQFPLSLVSWAGWAPHTTRREVLKTSAIPTLFKGEAVEQFAPTLLWSALYPNATYRLSLQTASIPTVFKGEAVEQFTTPPLSWQGWTPDRIPTLRPQTRIDGFSFTLQQLIIVVPALSWGGSAPVTTRRNVLPTADHSFVFKGEAIEQFSPTLLWYPQVPDRTPRTIPQTRIEGETLPLQSLTVSVFSSGWSGWTPDMTRRLSLSTSQIPSLFRGETVEQFMLSASVTAPDAIRRLPVRNTGLSVAPLSVTITVPQPGWDGWTPKRRSLTTAVYIPELPTPRPPTVSTLQTWNNVVPETTRRLRLPVSDLPFLFYVRTILPVSITSITLTGSYQPTLGIIAYVPPEAFAPSTLWQAGQITVQNTWESVAYLPTLNRFVAVASSGSTNRVVTSDDGGVTWTTRVSLSGDYKDVVYIPELSRLVAVAESSAPSPSNAYVMVSDDGGVTWVGKTTPVGLWQTIAWAPGFGTSIGTLFAVGAPFPNSVMSSNDGGETWSVESAPNSNFYYAVCYSDTTHRVVAVGEDVSGFPCIMTRDDGGTWVSQTSAVAEPLHGVVWSDEVGIFCAIGSTYVLTSPTGVVWTQHNLPIVLQGEWTSITASSNGFAAVGRTLTDGISMRSSDGVTWEAMTVPVNDTWFGITYASAIRRFVAVGTLLVDGLLAMFCVDSPELTITGTLISSITLTGEYDT